jgi:hypothetical protein
MKPSVVTGSLIAVSAVALALAGAVPAAAKHGRHHHHKASPEKHACGGKNGCPSKSDAKPDAKTDAAAPAKAVPAPPQ